VPSPVPAGLLSGLPLGLPAGLIDTGAILALVDRNDQWHEPCVETYNRNRLPWLTTEAVLTEAFYLVRRNLREDRAGWISYVPVQSGRPPLRTRNCLKFELSCPNSPTVSWISRMPRWFIWPTPQRHLHDRPR
jgi:hypothetical protein